MKEIIFKFIKNTLLLISNEKQIKLFKGKCEVIITYNKKTNKINSAFISNYAEFNKIEIKYEDIEEILKKYLLQIERDKKFKEMSKILNEK